MGFFLGGHPAAAGTVWAAAMAWAAFCRHPHRTPPIDPGLWVAPADGAVVEVTPESDGKTRIGVFMNLWHVHVNRLPYEGRIVSIVHQRGRFYPAFRPVARKVNEQVQMLVESPVGTYRLRQIAGVAARRIRCWRRPGWRGRTGEAFGMILLGSRVDVVLPPGVKARVAPGEHVRAGESVIAEVEVV